ncbi:MAG: HD domain-containing protein, partial [Firmicutes bacterium]|nr:HD domain-containing protein [Bacillota bacterium]
MRVARPLYSSSGTLLINRGVVLTAGIIRRLVELGVPGLYIEDGLALDLPVEDVIRDETRLKAVQQVRELLTAENGAERLQRALVRVEKIARTIDEIIDELLAKKDLVVNLTDIRTWDDYTFCHSVNVCVLSLLTGLTLGLSRADLFHLGMGTILHDLGKVKVPRDILNKATRLTDEEFSVIKRHTQWGYQMAQ